MLITIRVTYHSLGLRQFRHLTPVKLISFLQQFLQSIHSQRPLENLIAFQIVTESKFVLILDVEHVLSVGFQVIVAIWKKKYSVTLNRQVGQKMNLIKLAVSLHSLKRILGKNLLRTNLSISRTVANDPTNMVDCSSITLSK